MSWEIFGPYRQQELDTLRTKNAELEQQIAEAQLALEMCRRDKLNAEIKADGMESENASMRALMEKLVAPDAEVVSNTGYWYCFFCNSGIGRLPEKFHHEPSCPWIETRAFLAQHKE